MRLLFKTFYAMNDFDEMSLNINDDSGKQLSENNFFVRNVNTIKYFFATEFADLPLVLKHIRKLSTNDSLKV